MLVECCGGINLMNEEKELSDNCSADKPNKEEVRTSPTRYCKDASHSNILYLGQLLKLPLSSFVRNNKK
jgi:hypothetical protein